MLQLLLPLEGSDLLSLSRVYMSLTAGSLLFGQPILAAGLAAIAVFILQDNTISASSSALDQWLVLSFVSTAASLGSWVLLFVSSRQAAFVDDKDNNSFQTWFFGQLLQKAWACVIIFLLYQDASKKKDNDSSGGGGRRRGRTSGIELFEIHVRILQGSDLVPKDSNLLGRAISSDPYVVVNLGPNKLGKTPVVSKNLDPTWPLRHNSFRLVVLEKSLEVYQHLDCYIFDHDKISSDDPMGTVTVPIPPMHNLKIVNWYRVEKGSGEYFCHNAKGELLVEIEVRSKQRRQ